MSLSIATRLRPYSHRLGVSALIPLSDLQCQCFPTLWKISRIEQGVLQPLVELHFSHSGPSTGFTVCLDLESPSLLIWQETPLGFQKLRLEVDLERGLLLTVDRGSCVKVSLVAATSTQSEQQLQHKEELLVLPCEAFRAAAVVPFERLSLGSHKSQEVPPFSTKRDLFALLPIWMRLGALTPADRPCLYSGTASLLKQVDGANKHEERGTQLQNTLEMLLRTAFFDLFVPQLVDREYQGDLFSEPVESEDPLVLLTEGSKRLRACFLHTEGNHLHILPGLPTLFHAGRLIDAACGTMGSIHIEWTKRCIRQMIFVPKETGSLRFCLPPKIKRFRLRYGGTSRYIACAPSDELSFCLGQNLFFDRFEH